MAGAVRAKHLMTSCVEPGFGDDPYVALEHVESGTGRLVSDWTGEGKPDAAILFREGDVLFGKLRPYLAKTWVADCSGRCSGEVFVLRGGSHIQSRFIGYLTQSNSWLDWAGLTSYGSKMPRTSWSAMGELRVSLPGRPMQRAIADFLDRETAKIDALIAKQDALVARLLEHRRSMVAQGVDAHSFLRPRRG